MSEGRNTFRGKVAFVTHGGTGIGRAKALAFAREGASVAGQSREQPQTVIHHVRDCQGSSVRQLGRN